MQNIKPFLANLPHQPGVYQMLGKEGDVLYVGKARNLKKRISNYFAKSQKDLKTIALLAHIVNIELTVTNTENEALLLELNLIKKHKPHYNVLFRDDKSYPYILITGHHRFPQIDFFRGAKKKTGNYFGPYPNVIAVRETIHLIQKLFHLRTCTDSFFAARTRPCLLYQIGSCSGPCTDLISQADYLQNVNHAILFLEGKSPQVIKDLELKMEQASVQLNFELAARFRDQILQLRQIQERQYVSGTHGNVDVIGYAIRAGIVCIQLLIIRGGRMLGSRSYFPAIPPNSNQEEILSAFITQHYLSGVTREEIPQEIILNHTLSEYQWLAAALSEYAQHKVMITTSVRGGRKKWLEMATISANQSIINQLTNKANTFERFQALHAFLDLPKLPTRIECFDISHTMGEETVGSCVVFTQEGALKSDYRRYIVKEVTPGDDVGAMQHVLRRRYKLVQSEPSKLPDIVLIDGGKGQLNIAANVFKELEINSVLLIGVAKGVARKPGQETLHLMDQPPIHLSPDSSALHLIQQIRDEAHRFAITGHRLRRDKKRHTSILESIPGIGAKKRRELLRYFGGIQGVNRASLDELIKVPGISLELAQRILDSLNRNG